MPQDTPQDTPQDPSTNRPLTGRHALVTGGNRGIGAAIAAMLVDEGASVTITARNRDTLESKAAALRGRTHAPDRAPDSTKVCAIVLDVTDADAIASVFAQASADLGPIDILVNNAGAADSAPFKHLDRAHWDRILAVNLTSVYECCRAALPTMLENKYGRIINIASTAGLRGYAYVAAYAAAKHGVIGLTRSLALETARRGVTVNAICPGYTETDMAAQAIATIQQKTGRSAEEARDELARFNPQGRLVTTEEVAAAARWMCLPGSDAITGQSIAVAGGEIM